MTKTLLALVTVVTLTQIALAKPRARDLGIPFEGKPGPLNAITDVAGVEVGQVSIVSGKGELGSLHPARTGVTIVFPRGRKNVTGLPGAWGTLNANGEMTGIAWLEDSGFLEGPIGLTNTNSVGMVRDTLIEWIHKHFPEMDEDGPLPVVGETDDSWVNDIFSFYVKKKHVFDAIDAAKTGPVAEGNVGAGTGTVSFQFKAGIGTASRIVEGGYTVGVLVQSNFGARTDLHILGVPVGEEMKNEKLPVLNPLPRRDGSIDVILATDAPLLPNQMKRVVKRISVGIARLGGVGRNTSGELFVGFSTRAPEKDAKGLLHYTALPNEKLDEVFEGTAQATEEAIVNALVAAEDQKGINGNTFFALPHARLVELLKKYHRIP